MDYPAYGPKLEAIRCNRCGHELTLVTAVLDSAKGRTFRMYECKCGNRRLCTKTMAAQNMTWIVARKAAC